MTRFARGGPANKKKPHEASSWPQMTATQRQKQNAKRRSPDDEGPSWKPRFNKDRNHGNMSTKFKHAFTHSSSTHTHRFGNPRRQGDTWGGTDDMDREEEEEEDTDIIVPPKVTEPIGLAAELEELKQSTPNLTIEDEKEISEIIKKDKRREERRVKRVQHRQDGTICYHCRKTGHDMANCPKRGDSAEADGAGVCFKCGSTEHTLVQCRIKLPPGEYPYAKCFICGEQGHLSSRCPDNPRGLYPNGGCCKLCSSVEHFKKDCLKLQQEQGISDVRLTTWSDSRRSVDEEVVYSMKQDTSVKKKGPKIVKF